MTDKESILALKDGEVYIVPESDYGRAEIWKKNDRYFLFEIPTFGGEPRFVQAYGLHDIYVDEIVKLVASWT